MSPFTLKQTNTGVTVPCGKCPNCRSNRASAWSFRLIQEDKRSLSSNFVTLTYATEHVPILKSGYMSLNKSDLQKFFKRLRKLSIQRLRYYAVGEYGGKAGDRIIILFYSMLVLLMLYVLGAWMVMHWAQFISAM